MKVLWLLNSLPPAAREHFDVKGNNKEGWIEGVLTRIQESDKPDFELTIVFPVKSEDQVCEFRKAGIDYVSFLEDTDRPEYYDPYVEFQLREIVEKQAPQVIHIFGTEYPHCFAMALGCKEYRDKMLIGIQGVVSECAKHYCDGLPDKIINRKTFRDRVKKDGIKEQQEKFLKRASFEEAALKLVKHVTGRTEFDREFVKSVNPEVHYHYMSESMRACFYEGSWDQESCEKNALFLSQGNYPIKGAHYILEALPEIAKEIPDVKLYIAGDNITKNKTLFEKIKLSGYGKYLRILLKRGKLQDRVFFLGSLNAEAFKAQMLKSNAQVLVSTIENSPNSIGEAELLGLPTVTTDAGGITSIFDDGRDGIVYKAGSKEALIKAVIKMLKDTEMQKAYSENAKAHGKKLYDRDENYKTLLKIYEEIAG